MSQNTNLNFSQEEKDALKELCNIGIGKAASSMSELAGKKVIITVPNLEFYKVGSENPLKHLDEIVTIQMKQLFYGELSGQALVVLSRDGAIRLSQLLLDEEDSEPVFDENEQASILELGNIMIGGIMGSLANALGTAIRYDLPELQLKGFAGLFNLLDSDQPVILIVSATLTIGPEDISSYLILLFGKDDLITLEDKLKEIV